MTFSSEPPPPWKQECPDCGKEVEYFWGRFGAPETNHKCCRCGSGEWPEAHYDARGIFLTYACSKCEKEKLSGYRPEVLTDPQYDTMGETVEEDQW